MPNVRLDLFQELKSIHFGSPATMFGVLDFKVQFFSNFTTYNDIPRLQNAGFDPGGTYIVVGNGNVNNFPADLPVELPVFSDRMRSDGYMWSYPGYYTEDVHHHSGVTTVEDQASYLAARPFSPYEFGGVFTTSTIDGNPIPGGPFSTVLEAASFYFINLQPDPSNGTTGLGPNCSVASLLSVAGVDPDRITHLAPQDFDSFEVNSRSITFFNLSKIKRLKAFKHNPFFSFNVLTSASPINRRYHWTATVGAYLNVPNEEQVFDVDAQNEPLWFGTIGSYTSEATTDQDGVNTDLNVPASKSAFTINLTTAAVTGTRTNT